MAPMTRARNPDGIPNALNVLYHSQRASAGPIVTEGTPISRTARHSGRTGVADALQAADGGAAVRLGRARLRHVTGLPGRHARHRRARRTPGGGLRLGAEHLGVQPGHYSGRDAGQRHGGA
ncbi:hypothetical protein E0E53_15545 [Azotobacter chroococcum]|nr:hypothetical protein E0E53_15545 [Azotobacter chroococcum]